jgi:hypothetical protein
MGPRLKGHARAGERGRFGKQTYFSDDMNLPTVFETCQPREDVLRGTIAEADFAADLAKVIRRTAS